MSLQGSLFAEDVENDVTLFARDRRRKRVLVFPPVNNYWRFVIHQLVQDRFTDLLHTFSIGQGLDRRTVVCYKSDVIRDPKLNGAERKSGPATRTNESSCGMDVEGRRSPSASPEHADHEGEAVGDDRRPAARSAGRASGNHQHQPVQQNHAQRQHQQPLPPVTDSSALAKSSRQRRPDRAVYVPRHRRSLAEKGSPQPSSDNNRTGRPGQQHCVTSPATSKIPGNTPSKEADSSTRQSVEGLKEQDSKKNQSNAECDVSEGNAEERTEGRVPSAVECNDNRSDPMTDGKTDDRSERNVPNIIEKEGLEKSVMCERKSGDTETVCAEIDEISSESVADACTRLIDKPVVSDERTETSDAALLTKATVDGTKNDEASRESTDATVAAPVVPPVVSLIKVEKSNKEHSNRNEAINNKNKRLVRQNMVSDVLIISDSVREKKKQTKEVQAVPMTPPEKKVKKIERAKSKPAPPPSPPMKINRDECDWDSLFDDNGDCLDPTLIEELTSAVGEVTIEQPKNDYKAYTKQVEVSSDEFAHVVEIYNFPSDFKTSDLAAVFSPFKNGGFELKWVDDTHCLGVFSSPLIAAEVLASDHPFVKTRPLSEATTLSKTKARRSAEFLQPYRSRPKTCAALARRLVTGALGVKLATARQEREHEKNVLREAKEKRRLANKQREDAWEGIIPEKQYGQLT